MIHEILDEIQRSVEADTDLQNWCQNAFGKAPTFIIGVDDSNPPEQASYPVIALVGTESRRSTAEKDISVSLFFGLGIVDERVNEQVYSGTLLIERLRELFEDAIFSARLPGRKTVEGESGDVMYPLFVGYVELTVAAPKSFIEAMARTKI